MQHAQQSRPAHAPANAPYLTSYVQSVPPPQQVAQPGPLEMAIWMVHVEGAEVGGPVSAQQIAHAIRTGRLAPEASIQRSGEVFWTGLLDEPAIIAALKTL